MYTGSLLLFTMECQIECSFRDARNQAVFLNRPPIVLFHRDFQSDLAKTRQSQEWMTELKNLFFVVLLLWDPERTVCAAVSNSSTTPSPVREETSPYWHSGEESKWTKSRRSTVCSCIDLVGHFHSLKSSQPRKSECNFGTCSNVTGAFPWAFNSFIVCSSSRRSFFNPVLINKFCPPCRTVTNKNDWYVWTEIIHLARLDHQCLKLARKEVALPPDTTWSWLWRGCPDWTKRSREGRCQSVGNSAVSIDRSPLFLLRPKDRP